MTKLLRAVKDIMSTKTDCLKVEAVFHQMSPFVCWAVFEKVWYFLLGLFLPPTSSELFLSASESAALSSVAATIVSPSSLPSLHLVQVHPSQSPPGPARLFSSNTQATSNVEIRLHQAGS